MEVYSTTRPARPRVLLLLTAGLLVTMLGLAALQAESTRALGPRTRVAGTPLTVRPPHGWRPDPNNPGVFRPARGRVVRGGDELFRFVRYAYHYEGRYVDPLLFLDEIPGEPSFPPRRARLAGLDGIEVIRPRALRLGREIYPVETVLRVACSPQGDVVVLEYWPLAEIDQGEAALVDRLADAVQIEPRDP